MIFRAIFWIGLVALLMPHEPDLGFGRPSGLSAGVPDEVTALAKTVQPDLKDPASLCKYNTHACATSLSLLDNFRAMTVHSLAQVKADIEQSRPARSSGD
ncbi:MAG TPA: hypothetical protein VMF58_01525 [Rhizomicrobium sp.]|nr:hypothetical protein [Rhizomicrobium sp.]